MSSAIAQFMNLFRGFEHAHGQHELFGVPDATGKIKGKASTKALGASEKEYRAHLEGKGVSLGLIPLMADNTCWFAAIDVDISGPVKLKEPIEQLEARIRKLELPLVVCRSKSGGAHLYMFGSEPLPAKSLHGKLSEFSATLGYGGCEIFPKQFSRANDNDTGNWINIAMYGCLSKEGTTRYCIRNGKQIVKLEDFVKYVELMRVSRDALKQVEVQMSEKFSDGPPCLQHLATFGGWEGGRNNALVSICVYHKKANPDDWMDRARVDNDTLFPEPLPSDEVKQILTNNNRKDYFYKCNDAPIVSHCNKDLCKTRIHGIGNAAAQQDVPRIENITKSIARDSVRWYGEFQGKRFEFDSQFFNAHGFRMGMLKEFSILVMVKQTSLDNMFNESLKTVTEVFAPEDASRQGQFENLLDNFFSGSRPARNKDELIKGNSYVEDNRIHFRSEDLLSYLKVHKFDHTAHEIWRWLEESGAKDRRMYVRGKQLRVWTLPEPEKYDSSKGIDLPSKIEEEL